MSGGCATSSQQSNEVAGLNGIWAGQIEHWRERPGAVVSWNRTTTPLTLMISSAALDTGATGWYGITGKGFGRVSISVSQDPGGLITIRFKDGDRNEAELTLRDGKLGGTLLVGTEKRTVVFFKDR